MYACMLQVNNMYHRIVEATGRKAGPWSASEDALLLTAVDTHGQKWADIERLGLVPGRTLRQMKDRFKAVLNPGLDHGLLSAEVRVQIPVVPLFAGGCFLLLARSDDVRGIEWPDF